MNTLFVFFAFLFIQQTPQEFSGQENKLDVDVPRIEASVTIDGVLDEAVWSSAAKLTDFSQYQPVDGRPAADPTEVLVWYAPDAIYFGIRAFEQHGNVVRATKANRDNIASEDHVQILLDTYNDGRTDIIKPLQTGKALLKERRRIFLKRNKLLGV